MGKRSATATLAQLLVLLLRHRTCSQADLARECGVQSRVVRDRIGELIDAGVPIERSEDHPHVYYSVPPRWFPGGALFEGERAKEVVRLLARLPRTEDRERILSELLDAAGSVDRPQGNEAVSDAGAKVLDALEDASMRRVALRIRYFTASRGDRAVRYVSVHRILYSPRERFLAVCHRDDKLKWFRADGVEGAWLDETQSFRQLSDEQIDECLRTSIDGFRDDREASQVAFFVRAEDARWVVRNLPGPLLVDHRPDGILVHGKTAALEVLARFVVGLGDAARAETANLRERVVALASGSLRANGIALPRKAPAGVASAKSAAG